MLFLFKPLETTLNFETLETPPSLVLVMSSAIGANFWLGGIRIDLGVLFATFCSTEVFLPPPLMMIFEALTGFMIMCCSVDLLEELRDTGFGDTYFELFLVVTLGGVISLLIIERLSFYW